MPSKKGYVVYRFFDAAGQLLYVGVTSAFSHRMAVHRAKTPWMSEVTRIEVIDCPDKATAWATEAIAIQTERPRHNKQLHLGIVKKSVSMTEELAAAVVQQAEAEGHRNFSAVVVKAVQEYLLRHLFGKKVA